MIKVLVFVAPMVLGLPFVRAHASGLSTHEVGEHSVPHPSSITGLDLAGEYQVNDSDRRVRVIHNGSMVEAHWTAHGDPKKVGSKAFSGSYVDGRFEGKLRLTFPGTDKEEWFDITQFVVAEKGTISLTAKVHELLPNGEPGKTYELRVRFLPVVVTLTWVQPRDTRHQGRLRAKGSADKQVVAANYAKGLTVTLTLKSKSFQLDPKQPEFGVTISNEHPDAPRVHKDKPQSIRMVPGEHFTVRVKDNKHTLELTFDADRLLKDLKSGTNRNLLG